MIIDTDIIRESASKLYRDQFPEDGSDSLSLKDEFVQLHTRDKVLRLMDRVEDEARIHTPVEKLVELNSKFARPSCGQQF